MPGDCPAAARAWSKQIDGIRTAGASAHPGAHADPRTTKLYDRRRQQVTRGEVERIRYEKKQEMPMPGCRRRHDETSLFPPSLMLIPPVVDLPRFRGEVRAWD
jgi:hypothetical protein